MRSLAVPMQQKGFALLGAIFLLLVLALLGAYMLTIGGVQSRTAVSALQGARGYYAAQSGVEWGIYQALKAIPPSCGSSTVTVGSFSVDVSCSVESTFRESGVDYTLYRITSTAQNGTYPSDDYIRRTVVARIHKP